MSSTLNHGQDQIEIEEYRDRFTRLGRDLAHTIQAEESQEHEVAYAVDFSEIYAYLFPNKTAKEFCLFDDDDLSIISVFQDQALKRLFLNKHKKHKLVLLDSYAQEWKSFLENIARQEIGDILNDVHAAFKELENIQKDGEFNRLLQKFEKGQSLRDDEKEWLADFINTNAPNVLAVCSQRNSQIINRMQELDAKNFNSLKEFLSSETIESTELVDFLESLDSNPRVNHYYEKILSDRHRHDYDNSASSHLDAIAIATVEQTNEFLRGKNIKLLLVTRSEAMHRVVEEEQQITKHEVMRQSFREEKQGYSFLRHPRTFCDFFQKEIIKEEQRIEKHKEYLGTVNVFIEACELSKDKGTMQELEQDEDFQRKFLNVRRLWKSWTRIDASLTAAEEAKASESPKSLCRPNNEIAYKILRFCGNNGTGFREFLLDRVSSLAGMWKAEHQKLGVSLQGFAAEKFPEKDELVAESRPIKGSEKYKLLNSFYSLNFYSKEANQFLRKVDSSKQPNLNLLEVLDSVDLGKELEPQANYERLLALAFILGAILGDWGLAKRYCKLAVDVFNNESEVLQFEANYFLSVCMRKERLSCKEREDAIKHLKKAIEQRKKQKNEESPRYLQEYSLQILLWHDCKCDKSNKGIPSRQEGLDLLAKSERILTEKKEQQEQLSEEDNRLKIQICNNRLYYYVDPKNKARTIEQRRAILDEFKKLRFLLKDSKEIWLQRSPIILHTLVLASWYLDGHQGVDNDEFVRLKETLSESKRLSKKERQEIERTLKIIENQDK